MEDGYINNNPNPRAKNIFTKRQYIANYLAAFILDEAKDDEEKRKFISDLCVYSGVTAVNNVCDRSFKYRPECKELFEKWQRLTEAYIKEFAPEIIREERREYLLEFKEQTKEARRLRRETKDDLRTFREESSARMRARIEEEEEEEDRLKDDLETAFSEYERQLLKKSESGRKTGAAASGKGRKKATK